MTERTPSRERLGLSVRRSPSAALNLQRRSSNGRRDEPDPARRRGALKRISLMVEKTTLFFPTTSASAQADVASTPKYRMYGQAVRDEQVPIEWTDGNM